MKNMMIALLFALPLTATAAQKRTCYSHITTKPIPCRNVANKSFAGQNLRSTNWAGNDLSNSSFVEADLSHAVMFKTDLTGANFKNATMYGAALYGANFDKTNLDGANLNGADFNAADLRYAIITDRTTLNGSSYSRYTTKLPLAWGKYPTVEASRRGMLPLRESPPDRRRSND